MGLATIGPPSQKKHTEIYIMLIRLVLTEIQRFKNVKISKEMYAGRCVQTASGWPCIYFVNCGIFKWLYLAYYWAYLHQTWRFCKA